MFGAHLGKPVTRPMARVRGRGGAAASVASHQGKRQRPQQTESASDDVAQGRDLLRGLKAFSVVTQLLVSGGFGQSGSMHRGVYLHFPYHQVPGELARLIGHPALASTRIVTPDGMVVAKCFHELADQLRKHGDVELRLHVSVVIPDKPTLAPYLKVTGVACSTCVEGMGGCKVPRTR